MVVFAVAAVLFIHVLLGAPQPAAPKPTQAVPNPAPLFKTYCIGCHGPTVATAGIDFVRLTTSPSIAENYQAWEKVIAMLETKRMPPKGIPSPPDEQRAQTVSWIHGQLDAYVKAHAGDPGRVTVRRLTSGEYNYVMHDLTGLDLDLGIDASNDSVGGEGFTNFGDVQFMQDANLQRYLEAAKNVADHAVIGAGTVSFYVDPGKTGFEMSAIHRVKKITDAYGFRTVSGEGGFPFGLERYTKALFVAWEYQHRAALGKPTATFAALVAKEGITARFAEHLYRTMNRTDLMYPSTEMAARFHKLPGAGTDLAEVRKACDDLQKYITAWPGWLFARGDAAYGGAGDESPLIISDKSLKVEATHHFQFNAGGRGFGGGAGRGAAGARGGNAPPPAPTTTKFYLFASPVNPTAKGKPVVVWHDAKVIFRPAGFGRGAAAPTVNANGADDPNAVAAAATPGAGRGRGAGLPGVPLRTVVTEECAKHLNFGNSPDSARIGPDDFASDQSSIMIEVTIPPGMAGVVFQADAGVGADPDQVFRVIITNREDGGSRGIPVRAILGNPQSAGYRTFKAGVLQLADVMPPNSQSPDTPADKDPPPEPFDPTYNVPEHDAFDNDVKYVRDDRFLYQSILDEEARRKLDQAWNDVYTSFEYHDHYWKLIAEHYHLTSLQSKHISELTKADFDFMPAEARGYATSLRATYDSALAAEKAAQPRHLEDCLEFASRAWRRPLTDKEKATLRAFYQKTLTEDPDHVRAIRTLIARILVAPEFLYKLEQPSGSLIKPASTSTGLPTQAALSNWEMASRMSFFIWSSIPDDELRRAARAGELSDPKRLREQTIRMLADPKARRMATEFFGQWLGFYHFDQFKGVDTSRFPEFTQEVKSSMYDEAVSFFEYIIRNNRPVSELLNAKYDFLNAPLAKYYGVSQESKSKTEVEKVDNADSFHRGGLLRLGAVLTATSAPLRTSPVRRGDWVLRRILGTAVPPPPADAGSIPADPKLFGGLSVRERLQVHKRNATCATCHSRIDPLGFPLEHYDSTGRWRDKYSEGQNIDDYGDLSDSTRISGIDGLLDYLLDRQSAQVQRTLAHKLVGYALGRTIQLSDDPLIENLAKAGSGAGIDDIVSEIVLSKQFRNRAASDEPPVAPLTRAAVQPQRPQSNQTGRQ